jgi:hypothetical protein
MSRLTLRLPDTLHQQLIHIADSEGVSLNQYIVYALTRQSSTAYTVQPTSTEDRNQQNQDFANLLQKLSEGSSIEIETALADREIAAPEQELTPAIIARFKQRIL